MTIKKITLIVVSAVVALMGIAEITGLLNLGVEPVWHAWLKILVGIAGIAVPYVLADKINLALYVIGGALAAMGVLALIPGLNYAVEPMWHAAVKVVAGAAVLYIAYMKEAKHSAAKKSKK